MLIIFRCNSCETINDIPSNLLYRFCKKCGNIITYKPGEAILGEYSTGNSNKFLQSGKLSQSDAPLFFDLADTHSEQISEIIKELKNIPVSLLDLHVTSVPDIVISIIKLSTSNTIDEIVRNCKLFDISLTKLEKLLIQLKKEGLIYQPKNWLIVLA